MCTVPFKRCVFEARLKQDYCGEYAGVKVYHFCILVFVLVKLMLRSTSFNWDIEKQKCIIGFILAVEIYKCQRTSQQCYFLTIQRA